MTNESTPALTYPRLSLAYLKSKIVAENYYYFERTRTTVCSILLDNGFSLTASVVCANPDSYDAEAGQRHAFNKAIEKLRKREYYVLRQRLFEEQSTHLGDGNES